MKTSVTMILLISAFAVFVMFLNLAAFQANHVFDHLAKKYNNERKAARLSAIDPLHKFKLEDWNSNVPIVSRGASQRGILENKERDKIKYFWYKWQRIY